MDNSKVYITAEGEINHNGEVKIAREMILTAHDIGADAIKFLIYKTDDFVEQDSPYYDIFKGNEFEFSQWRELKQYADQVGIVMYCTPAHNSAVESIVKLELPYIKIGSTNITNFPLLKVCAQTGKPILLSTGASTIGEVDNAVSYIAQNNGTLKMLYHCTAHYPALPENIDLQVIPTLKLNYPAITIGFSDHSLGTAASVGAVCLGAKAIEKHFTLDSTMTGPDHSFSTNKEDFKVLIENIREAESMLQSGVKKYQVSECTIRLKGRRYLAAAAAIAAGDVLDEHNVQCMRVNIDSSDNIISPEYYDRVLNKKINVALEKGAPLTWGMI